ncbi:Gfo/Idh/MocA family oxidoreductase [Ruegeria sp. WL0004]|uniref:Gfo/Idh/MocA family oxidoreductase n=1 Tax=Ruegeria marisflavi TaxID=2984152 RepID=A0ABT2WWC3_9RHOB|nr:Gfo/Idh/MocA family oxidoreductase [Ruegeria sp. WL0004]MCU9840198.1 Gfo/Idh/MocA family oxidoreductase [Ruegeria sp. WL0004]
MTGKPMHTVLIGLGMVTDLHANAIAATDGEVVLAAVYARNPERAHAFANRHGGPRVMTSLDEIVADRTLDFAILATPPDARAPYIPTFARRGLPVLTEKPLARTVDEARALIETCETAGLPLGVLLQHRMRPAALALQNRLAQGELGEIATVELRVPWWRDQSYYDTPGRGTRSRDGGGVLITQAIHSLDLMLQFCGPVADVQAITATSPLHQMEAEDFAAAALRFRSGAVGSVMASVTHYPGGAEEIVINCTAGSAHLAANRLMLHRHGHPPEEIGTLSGTGGGADPMAFSHDWHRAVIADFAEALRNGRQPAITGRSALPVQALIAAIERSARTGQRQDVADG